MVGGELSIKLSGVDVLKIWRKRPTDLISDEGVCRIDLATPVLLVLTLRLKHKLAMSHIVLNYLKAVGLIWRLKPKYTKRCLQLKII